MYIRMFNSFESVLYCMTIESVELGENGDIVVGDEVVGFLGWSENVLVDIHVDSHIRGQGVATYAITEMVSRVLDSGYSVVETTTVVNPAMERALEKVGFDSRVEESLLYEPDELSGEISVEDIPVEEEVVWEYRSH